MRNFIALVITLMFAIPAWTQSIDRSFRPRTLVHTNPHHVVTTADGSVFLSGALDYVNGEYAGNIVKMKADGEIDHSFNVYPGSEAAYVEAIAPLNDGDIIAIGGFRYFAGSGSSGIVRLNADGGLDPAFTFSLNGAFSAVGVQSDGKIVVCGTTQGAPYNFIKRLNSDGTLDETFVAPDGPHGIVNQILILPDDKIIVGGNFVEYGLMPTGNDLIRLDVNGDYDETFNAGFSDDTDEAVLKVERLSSGALIVEVSDGSPLKLNEDGSPDESFDGTGIDGSGLAVLSDGSMIVRSSNVLSKYDAEGEFVSSIEIPFESGELFTFSDDKILAAFHGSDPIVTHMAFNSDLTTSDDWNPFVLLASVNELPYNFDHDNNRELIQQPGGKLLIHTAGEFYTNGTTEDLHAVNVLFRLEEDLSFDESFVQDLANPLYHIELEFVDEHSRIYLNQQIHDQWSLIRLTPDGTQDQTFSSVQGKFVSIDELTDSNFVAALEFDNWTEMARVVKFDESGAVDPNFDVAFDLPVKSVDIASDGDIYVTTDRPDIYGTPYVFKVVGGVFNNVPSLSTYQTVTAEAYNDRLYVAGSFVRNAGATLSYPLEIYSDTGVSSVNEDEKLVYKVGKDLVIDGENDYVYVLSGELLQSLTYYLHRFHLDGSLDRRFKTVTFTREYLPSFTREEKLFLLPDKSLVVSPDSIYHVVLPGLPNGASGLTLTENENSIHLRWNDNSDNETVFEIERSTDGGENYTLAGIVDENQITFNDDKGPAGTYTYRVMAANARGVAIDYENVSIDVTEVINGLADQAGNLKVYPNPAKDQIYVESNDVIQRFTVLQPDGRLVESARPNSNLIYIDVNNYAAGLYLLKVEKSTGTQVLKIFKR